MGFFNDPATILTRWHGNTELEFEDEETAIFRIYESAVSAGLDISSSDFIVDLDKDQLKLEDFTTGFIQGRLSRILEDDVRVTEITDYSGQSKCAEYRVELD